MHLPVLVRVGFEGGISPAGQRLDTGNKKPQAVELPGFLDW